MNTKGLKQKFLYLYNQRKIYHWNYLDFGLVDRVIEDSIRKNSFSNLSPEVLDFGCGEMQPNKKLLEHLGFTYTGLDLVSIPNTICWNQKLPLTIKSDSFDLILLNGSIFYLQNMEDTLKEFYRILKPNGVLVFSTPIFSPLSGDYKELRNSEIVRFMPKGIHRKLTELEYCETQIQYVGGPGSICGAFLYLIWEKVFKTNGEENRISNYALPLFPVFLCLTTFLNLIGLFINSTVRSERFAPFIVVDTIKKPQ